MPSILGCFMRPIVTMCDVIDPTMKLGCISRAREIPSCCVAVETVGFQGHLAPTSKLPNRAVRLLPCVAPHLDENNFNS